MARKPKRRVLDVNGLSPIEVDVMQIIWQKERVTVREVHEIQLKKGYIPYTTVMAVMNNLSNKGLLAQNKDSKAYAYSATLDKNEVANSIVDNIVDRVLGGSATPILRHLLKLKSDSEVEEIVELKDKLNS